MFDAAERERIEAAVRLAEQGTSGEIVCVYERKLEPDRTTPWLAAALSALSLPPPLLVAFEQLAMPWASPAPSSGVARCSPSTSHVAPTTRTSWPTAWWCSSA